jgi:hypothetical protein
VTTGRPRRRTGSATLLDAVPGGSQPRPLVSVMLGIRRLIRRYGQAGRFVYKSCSDPLIGLAHPRYHMPAS